MNFTKKLLKEAGFDKDSAMKAIMNLYHQNKTNQETDSMGFSIKSALPAVVSAWSILVAQDELPGLALGQSADSRGGVESL